MPDFNSPKNPLPDLMPLEEDRSTEVSSQELSAIRASLMETSWRTEQIVDVLERKNILLERDLEKITNLKRRLRRSIGIIPGMPGKAGALFGAGVGMGLILPFGFKWPESEPPNIPPIGKAPKRPVLDPQPITIPIFDPIFNFIRNFLPEDITVPVPGDITQPVPGDITQPIPGDVTQPFPGDVTGGLVDNPGGGIIDPGPLIGGKRADEIPDGGGKVIIPGDPIFAFDPGFDFKFDTTLQGLDTYNFFDVPKEVGEWDWIDALTTAQIWEILKANLKNPVVWTILAIAGLSLAALLIPADAQILSALGAGAVLVKLKAAIISGKILVPAAIKKAAILLASKKTAAVTALSLTGAYNFSPGYAEGLNLDSTFYNSETFKLNTGKTNTFLIITDELKD